MRRLLGLSASHERLRSRSATPAMYGGRRPARAPPGGSTFTTPAPRAPRILPARKPDSSVESRTRRSESTLPILRDRDGRAERRSLAYLADVQVRELFDLSGRAALVTGGGRGIGRHVAIGLAEAGARVFVASRKRAACEETAAAIRAAGGEADALE